MNRPDLILHIGQSKTGTSSIQRVLGARRDQLASLGVCYPRSPGWANHGLLPASLVPLERLGHFNPALWEGMGPAARLARFRTEFAAEMATLPEGTRLVVISAEQCSGLLAGEAEVARLRDALAPHVDAIRVVVYLRRQDSHFASSYTQALRVAQISPPALPRSGPDVLRQYDYAALLDLWARVFGDAAIEPRIFEPESLLNGDAVDDFLAAGGIGLAVPADDPDRQSNVSLSPDGIDLVRAIGEWLRTCEPGGLSPASPLWRRFVNAANETLPGRGWRPSAAEAEAFLARFEGVNEAVRRRWFPGRERLFAGPVPDAAAAFRPPAAPPPVDAAAALKAACALILRETKEALAREAQVQVTVARLHEKLGEAEQARNAYRAALRSDPGHAFAHLRLLEIGLASNDRLMAEAHLAALRGAAPDHPGLPRLTRQVEALSRGGAVQGPAPRSARG